MADWCILRTSGGNTMQLAESLADAGYEVWTPIETRDQRLPRKQERTTVRLPLMPSFVFARAQHLGELINLSHSPALQYRVWDSELRRMVVKGHPMFSLFRHGGLYPLIPEYQLLPLRIAEKRTAPKPTPTAFKPGDRVTLTEGGFSGLTGTVQETRGGFASVVFPGFNIAVKIATWILLADIDEGMEVGLDSAQIAAKAA